MYSFLNQNLFTQTDRMYLTRQVSDTIFLSIEGNKNALNPPPINKTDMIRIGRNGLVLIRTANISVPAIAPIRPAAD